ncbi:39S ribosomal protein L37, mitochondrial-like [Pecten maximus]|uniref:39S ribosomal protein L37, mitochondrial-like n=1 Tax=Pecten maximus TaxID=6579 RepID=UPI001458BDEE|nr:39S ribosomal protein L37, mitochondrial-like [Pecten maximus]
MKLTPPLLKQISKPFKKVWAAKYPSKAYDLPDIPKGLVKKGIRITKPLQTERVVTQQLDHVTLPTDETEQPGYNSEPVWEFTDNNRFIEGLKQAQNLTKSIIYSGMPDGVSSLIDKVEHPQQNELLKRIILQSQVWDPAKDKLPKRIDKSYIKWHFQREYGIPRNRSIRILNTNLVRLANSLIHSQYPAALTDTQLHIQPAFDTHYTFMGEKIVIKSTPSFLLTGNNTLPRFSDKETVANTTEEALPNMFPILPTIDLQSTHYYTLTNSIVVLVLVLIGVTIFVVMRRWDRLFMAWNRTIFRQIHNFALKRDARGVFYEVRVRYKNRGYCKSCIM